MVGVPVGYTCTNVGKYQILNFSGFMQMKQKSFLVALSAVILLADISTPVHALTQNEASPSGENTSVVVWSSNLVLLERASSLVLRDLVKLYSCVLILNSKC